MIHLIDKNADKCARTTYEAISYIDYNLANSIFCPLDNEFVNYKEDNLYYIVSPNGSYNDNNTDLIPEVINNVKQKKYKLLYDFSFEGDERGISNFIRQMEENGIDESCYKILTSSQKIKGRFPEKVCHFPMFEIKAWYNLTQNHVYNFNRSEHKNFLMLNARPRPHRIYLTYLLNKRNLLDNGFCSLPSEESYTEEFDFEHEVKQIETLGVMLDNRWKENLKSKLPLTVDDVNFNDSFSINDTIISDIYNNIDFAVVTESMINSGQDVVFITEKIFKPIANKKPFIVLGDKGTLAYMRKLGYKTFDFLINEDYDVLNSKDRIIAVAKEIERLCNVDFKKYKNKINEVTEHNYQVLLDSTRYLPYINDVVNFLKEKDD